MSPPLSAYAPAYVADPDPDPDAALRLAATVFEAAQGMMVTDAHGRIVQVNRAFVRITGYSSEEVVGQTPRLLSSGRHVPDFYTVMWTAIARDGIWEGEIWNRRKNGEVYPEHLSITAVRDNGGEITNYVAALTDITLSKAANDEIRSLAFYDPLTRLPNRRLLLDRLRQVLAASGQHDHYCALMFIDLDNFKILNDTLGHNVGDLLLSQVAERLQSSLRKGDTVARLGGDEFVVLVEGLSSGALEAAAEVESLGAKILAALNRPYELGTHHCRSTPSIGATLFHNGEPPLPDDLLKQADIAMYQAKQAGRNGMRFFDRQMQDRISERAQMENDLRHAIERDQFVLHYQVQVDQHGKARGAEALIRWIRGDGTTVSPASFIPLAEETGLILSIGRWVLETACAQLAAWQTAPRMAQLVLAINVSAQQFHQPDFGAEVRAAVERHGIDPRSLKLELTEGVLLDKIEETIACMQELKAIGVRFSLDDFGTGYSSLQYLKRLPLSQLKIDQSFVRDLASDSNDQVIVRTIIAMARSLQLDVIAEGVETMAQRVLLEELGCRRYQGYLYSRPVPEAALGALVTE
ncbi:putative bifunctional diguanylate cyclase/phosphodiesterase [Duganella violaceipulchra]|uniref:Diguanylate cyclase (GGDEF)-like protein/PAS domain S-box-containing protein n=1 Tax=Duganella violaceipulchra TaxID=2849652 RepID=A0AA41HFU2_9BURK|nr:GGDEF domain-containing phosphodiesterase [Duganella violaceicalia]MBV6323719.1 EAL domain-containing protein [Duganella violaceicalia]MCP2007404.1 diguanylate cyclase (GGDEF)-like protein/PAS domain S-box-containing protein [Duganella violaceicalia]